MLNCYKILEGANFIKDKWKEIDKVYRTEYHPKHKGNGHYGCNHYHVLKLGEFSKAGKASPLFQKHNREDGRKLM